MTLSSSSSPAIALVTTAARTISNARHVLVLTGAGISEESGVPTYRNIAFASEKDKARTSSRDGLWDNTTTTTSGIWGSLGALVFGTRIGWFFAPQKAWELYVDKLLRPIVLSKPNAAHLALYELEKLRNNSSLPIITQNVDGLHIKAGNSCVLEVHGTVREHRCTFGGKLLSAKGNETIEKQVAAMGSINSSIPMCCSTQCWWGAIRPNVVLFGERMPFHTWIKAYNHVKQLGPNDVLLVVGTSLQVQPVASLPTMALERGATVIEVNPSDSPAISREITYAMDDGNGNTTAAYTRWAKEYQHIFLCGKAGIVLPKLLEAIKREYAMASSNTGDL